jgi:hypothetical protein
MNSLPSTLAKMQQRLRREQSPEAAWAIIDEYFSCNGPDGIREELWIMAKGAITNDLITDSAASRHELLFGYEFLQLMVEAVGLLHNRQKKQPADFLMLK